MTPKWASYLPNAATASILLFSLIGIAAVTAAAQDRSPGTLKLETETQPLEVAPYVWFLKDQSGELDLAAVQTMSDRFEHNGSDQVNFGLAGPVIWLRLDVENPSQAAADWVVTLNRRSLRTAEIYLEQDHNTDVIYSNEQAHQPDASFQEFGAIAAQFTLPEQSKARLYVRYLAQSASALPLALKTPTGIAKYQQDRQTLFLFVAAGILTLVLYNGVMFGFTRQRSLILYAFAQICLFLYWAHQAGYLNLYVWPYAPQLGRGFSVISSLLISMSMLMFGVRFLETGRRTPRIDRVLRYLIYACGMGLVASIGSIYFPIISMPLLGLFAIIITLVSWTILPALAVIASMRWSLTYLPLALAWCSLAFGGIYAALSQVDLLPVLESRDAALGALVYFDGLCLTFSIALRLRQIQSDALDAGEKLTESLAAQLEESKRAERLAGERALALQEAADKGQLLMAAGHDSRQMISALRNFAEGLRHSPTEERVRLATDAIDQVTDTLEGVLSTAITGSYGGTDATVLAIEEVLDDALLDPLRLIYSKRASEKGLILKFRSLGHYAVVDRVLVQRILGNLISNAVKYTQAGKILVACRKRSNGILFQVYDTGSGIEPADLKLLLTPDRGQQRLSRVADGEGVGLMLAQQLAEKMGAALSARSEPGTGSCFELWIPNITSADLSPFKRIGVLENEPDISSLVSEHFTNTTVEHWTDKETAIAAAKKPESNLLLVLDVNFGSAGEGIKIAETIRKIGTTRIAMLSYDRSVEQRTALSRTADIILYRPATQTSFAAALSHLK